MHAIIGRPWAISREAALAHAATVKAFLEGTNPVVADALSPIYSYKIAAYSPDGEPDNDDMAADPDSGEILVINVQDVILKQNTTECGYVLSMGTSAMNDLILEAQEDNNLMAIVLYIDSPGGMVDGTKTLGDTIAASNIPVYAFVDGMCCSAAYWLASQCKAIYAKDTTDQIGCIGTMLSFADMRPYWEKQGVNFYEVYATDSTDKNNEVNSLLAGDDTLIKQQLDALNDMFLTAVQSGRGSRLQSGAEGVLSGKTFLSEIALANGMIDGIQTWQQTIKSIASAELANYQTKQQKKVNVNTPTMKKHLTQLAASLFMFLGFKEVKADAENEVTDDMFNALVTRANQADAFEQASKETRLELEAVKATLVEKEAHIASLQAENERLGNLAGATHTPHAMPALETTQKGNEFETSADREARKLYEEAQAFKQQAKS